jgi:hypothetical protein
LANIKLITALREVFSARGFKGRAFRPPNPHSSPWELENSQGFLPNNLTIFLIFANIVKTMSV